VDFAFSEDQIALRGIAREVLAERFPPAHVAVLADSDAGWETESWRQLAEMGWLSLSADPETAAEASFLDEAVLLEEAGYGLYPGPFFATVALVMPALLAGAEAAADVRAAVAEGRASATLAWSEARRPRSVGAHPDPQVRAETTGTGAVVSGTKVLVPDGASVSHLVVLAGTGQGPTLFLVEAAGADVRPVSTSDRTRRYAEVTFDATPATVLVDAERTPEVVRVTRLRVLAALAVEAIGVGQATLDIAAAHAKGREQFGRLIGTYQGVSHRVADMYTRIELARSLAYRAAWCVAEPGALPQREAASAVSMAKAAAAGAAVFAAEGAIQVLGGMGFTWEHVLHRYYKRALWIESFEGSAAEHRAVVAAALLD
jgi:alkylation response protein AidB-like acyl-CoA dehydrogenase